jgi:hypothetical protein
MQGLSLQPTVRSGLAIVRPMQGKGKRSPALDCLLPARQPARRGNAGLALPGIPGASTIVTLPSLIIATLMGKKLKNLWHNRKYLIVLVILVLIGAGWIYFLLDRHIYPVNLNDPHLEQRIAFVSLWVGIVGFSLAVLGTVLAVLQFQASQRKPILRLWLGEVGQKRIALTPEDSSFSLIIQNTGSRVARHVRCKVQFHHLPDLVTDEVGQRWLVMSSRLDLAAASANWSRSSWQVEGHESPIAIFSGGSDDIIYDDESGETLGRFEVDLRYLKQQDCREYKLEWEIRCEGMKRKEGELWIEVSEDARS